MPANRIAPAPARFQSVTRPSYSADNRSPYGHRWRQARERFLMNNPFCKHCEQRDELTAAQCVDHITPHRGDMRLFWNEDNWQSLCNACHSVKTATEDTL